MYAHWEAEIYVYLSARKIVLPFNTMQDLLTNTDMKVMTFLGTTCSNAFEFSNESDRVRIWHERMKPNLEIYYEYGGNRDGLLDLILDDESYAVYNNEAVWTVRKEYKDCKILRAPGRYDLTYSAFALQKHSPYRFVFNYFIQRIMENGLINRYLKDIVDDRQFCPDYSGKPVNISMCFTAFIVLFCGTTVSIILLLAEGAAKILKCAKKKNSNMNE